MKVIDKAHEEIQQEKKKKKRAKKQRKGIVSVLPENCTTIFASEKSPNHHSNIVFVNPG
jgi:hypothetical protein